MNKQYKIVLVESKVDYKIKQIFYLSGRVKPTLAFGNINDDFHNADDAKPQDLYVVSDEEIKVGDWAIGYAVGFKGKGAKHFLFKHDNSKMAKLNAICVGNRKVIATTNPKLWEDLNIPKIDKHIVSMYIMSWNNGNTKEQEVTLEKAVCCMGYDTIHAIECGECAAEEKDYPIKTINDTVIIHFVSKKEKKYSKHDLELAFEAGTLYQCDPNNPKFNEWCNKTYPE